MDPLAGPLGVKKVGAKYNSQRLTLAPSAHLDAQQIIDLGRQSVFLGQVPHPPHKAFANPKDGLNFCQKLGISTKSKPSRLPAITRTKLSKSASEMALPAGDLPDTEDPERPSSAKPRREEYQAVTWQKKAEGRKPREMTFDKDHLPPYLQLVPPDPHRKSTGHQAGQEVMSGLTTALQAEHDPRSRPCFPARVLPYGYAKPAFLPRTQDQQIALPPPEQEKDFVLEQFDEPERFELYMEQEWLNVCRAQLLQEGPQAPNADIWHFVDGQYAHVKAWIHDYDPELRRYTCEVITTGETKLVKRLAVRFTLEDPDKYAARLAHCEEKRQLALLARKLSATIEQVPSEGFADMTGEQKAKLVRLVLANSRLENPEEYVPSLKELLLGAEASYVLAMKFAILKQELILRNGFPDAALRPTEFRPLLEPYLPQPAPLRGQVASGDWKISRVVPELAAQPPFGAVIVSVTQMVYTRYQDTLAPMRLLDVERGRSKVMLMGGDLELAADAIARQLRSTTSTAAPEALWLKDWLGQMQAHRDQVMKLVNSEWRTYIVSEVLDRLADTYNFFVDSPQAYDSSELQRFLLKCDLVMRSQLRQLFASSVSAWCDFVRSFLIYTPHRPLRHAPPAQLLKVSVTAKDGRILLSPSREELVQQIDELVASLPEALRQINTTEHEMVPCMNFAPKRLYDGSCDPDFLSAGRDLTRNVLDHCLQLPERLVAAYVEFEFLLTDALPEDFDPQALDECRERIGFYYQARDDVLNISSQVERFPLFEVHCQPAVAALTQSANALAEDMLRRMKEDVEDGLYEMHKEWTVCQATVRAVPSNEKELAELKDYLSKINSVIKPKEAWLKTAKKQLEILADNAYEVPEHIIEDSFEHMHWPYTVKLDVGVRLSEIENEKTKFIEILNQDRKQFFEDCASWQKRIEVIATTFDDYDQANSYAAEVNGLQEALDDGLVRVENFNQREHLFGSDPTQRDDLEDMIRDYAVYYKLWELCIKFRDSADTWTKDPMKQLNAEDVTSSIDGWARAANQLKKQLQSVELPIQIKIVEALVAAMKDFRKYLPVIESLCHDAIQQSHWYDMFEMMDVDPDVDVNDMSLKFLCDLGVLDFVEELQGIAAAAQKQFSLRRALQSMKDEWRTCTYETMAYKESGTYLLKGIDDVQTLLDDHIVKVQAIRGSPFCQPFRRDAEDWEKKLILIQDSLDQVLMVQKTWLYLEPIFASDDIIRQMPGEAKKFQAIDTLWRQTLGMINENPSVLDFSEIEGVLPNFIDANKKLDEITKSLNDYLETKRLYFPRFFFLSNEELLSILSETKDPTRVQPHMNKAFEGIAKVRFDKGNEIIEAMVSAEGEVVELFNKVNVMAGDNRGNVEKWLLQTEHSMIQCLRVITDNSVKDYAKQPRHKWVLEWQGQVVLAVDMIYWSKECEEWLNKADIAGYLKIMQGQLGEVVKLVRGELSKLNRKTLAAMTTIDVHNRDVVIKLVEDNISAATEFEWMAQLRYYWCQPGTVPVKNKGGKINDCVECEVKIVNSCLLYAFEYLGNSDRLVITPLTDRCYRTLMGAFHLYYGGAPEGPAGTGKTESVKDLAKALAMQCVVFNCSDGLDFIAMGKFFKGLASSGAWCCFDEFNRINVEVLSVIAQQVMVIQFAIREHKTKFIFEGTELSLIPSCGVNITMNPGYAGRAELPDNLKALFRPCAMMVPDYALIGEIFLYSYGFANAKELGRKATQALRLSSEQLSAQDHYDFGMRGLKSLLVASGAGKRKYGDTLPESTIAFKAFLDVNQPKFTAGDIPLFAGIISDLFPNVEKPPEDNQALEEAITKATEELGYQANQYHVLKVVQLWETILVRHGLMVVGLPPCGKSAVNMALQGTLALLDDQDVFMPVTRYLINPKSIFQRQLYGSFDENTHEWADGVLAIAVRTTTMAMGDGRRQWIQLDGPVDAIWIEDMNTVLDDNKKLCLLSGEIIKLSPVTNMIFEVADLAVASPATVSRVGVIFMEPQNLGWRPPVTSWIEAQPEHIYERLGEHLVELFDANLDALIVQLRRCKLPIPCPLISIGIESWMGISICRLLEALLMYHFNPKKLPSQAEMEVKCDALFYFACLWVIGGCTDETGRPKIELMLRDIMAQTNESMFKSKWDLNGICEWRPVPSKQNVPDADKGTLFDFYVDDFGKWSSWNQKMAKLDLDPKAEFHTIIVPTLDMTRNQYILAQNIAAEKHTLFSGITGTGKTVAAQNMLLKNMDKERYVSMAFAFSAQTTHNQTQDIIDGKLDKRRKGVFGPAMGKRMLIFVDDLNMPAMETYGAQGAIEILRQFMYQGGWYDRKSFDLKKLIEISFIGAMAPPGAGKNNITARYAWNFNFLFFVPYVGDGLNKIFETIMKSYLSQFGSAISGAAKGLVAGSISIYESVASNLLPTPEKSHYTFNLRDMSRVFQGISMCQKESLPDVDALVRCWAHELQRVFQDRLINSTDSDWFEGILKTEMETSFKKKWSAIVKVEPMVWGSFMYPAKPWYQEITDHDELIVRVQECLTDFNGMSKRQMALVLFVAFVQHVSRICRVLDLPMGNALCIGVGGSGRKSVCTLASFVVDYDVFQIEISKSYGQNDWHEDMKRLLMGCGGAKQTRTTFLFSDTQVQQETFLEDISNILNTGEVPNLYAQEDKMTIQEGCQKLANADGAQTPAEIFSWYVDKCKKNCHIVLCLSPIGGAFRARLRSYPSLVNCCTIDWFLEWPKEALLAVGKQFMKQVDLDPTVSAGVVRVMVQMHSGIYATTDRFRKVIKRHYYVTPTSYLELINSFTTLIGRQRNAVTTAKGRYDGGLEKINTTATMVDGMKAELEALQPVLKKTSEENALKMIDIEAGQKDAAVTRAIVEKEEAIANEQAESARIMSEDCQKDLDEAMPALHDAVNALKSLSKADITEVKAMKTPPSAVILTSHALCYMFGVSAVKVKAPDGKGKVDDYWEPSKKILYSDTKLLENMINYDKDNMSDQLVAKVTPFYHDPAFAPDIVAKGSKAAAGICKWIRAMVVYNRVAKVVEPKKLQLAEAQAASAIALATLAEKKAELQEVVDRVQKLEDDLAFSKQKQDDLEKQAETCRVQLIRAEKLLVNLGGEKGRWEVLSEKLGVAFVNLTGDILISAGVVAYMGVFNQLLRTESLTSWLDKLHEEKIPAGASFDLAAIIGDEIKIRQWLINKLPNDTVSKENAIIQDNARRWPLMIDPQLQANKWIRSEHGEKLKVLRLSRSDYGRMLENAIQFGFPVLIENILETLDPMLEPLLQKATFKAGSLLMIRLGDTTLEYNVDFKLFLTTKLPNPHYAPEICVTVAMLNFVTTVEGLADQLLAVLVAKEYPDIEARRQNLIVESAESAAQLKDIENKILYLLSESKGNILEDEVLINTLADSKVQSVRIEERVVVQERTKREILETQKILQPVAERSANLFFVTSDLSTVEPMYQYSLEWFVNIYVTAIDGAEKARGEARLRNLNNEFIKRLYDNVCRSLFEKDKLLLSVLFALRMLTFDKELDQEAATLFFTGGGGGGSFTKPKPSAGVWFQDVMWGKVLELDKLHASRPDGVFHNFADKFAASIDGWQTVFDCDFPKTISWPDDMLTKSTNLEQALILQCIRTDANVSSMQDIIRDKLNTPAKNFLEPPPFDLEVFYEDSRPEVPLIFVLTTGADPIAVLRKLGEKKGMMERMKLISLGQGQGPKATAEIEAGTTDGMWVTLQNCHLATSYMPILEAKVENFDPETLDGNFRLWLTAMPSNTFPVSVLQNGIKMTVEPPKGLKSNLALAFATVDEEWMESNDKPHEFKKMFFSISFFHALILERRKFGPLGWNIPYQFSDQDREISIKQLYMFLNEFAEVPYKALNYMVAECNYGGRVTDGQDRDTIQQILTDFITPDVLDAKYTFSVSGVYYSPDTSFTKDQYMNFIKSLPLNENPEAFWLHQNADLTALINEGAGVQKNVVGMMPRDDSGGGGLSDEDRYCQIAKEIVDRIPAVEFDLEAVLRAYPPKYEDGTNVVLVQELIRFNRLFRVVRTTLVNLQKAVAGLVVMDDTLEEVAAMLLQGKVPQAWKKVSFASLKLLGGYVEDFIQRMQMFQDWVDKGKPVVFWVSGFFFTQAFLTGILQNMARVDKCAIDQVVWNFKVQRKESLAPSMADPYGCGGFLKQPEKGTYIYGMYMEGARWDDDTQVIAESFPKVLFDLFPIIYMEPVTIDASKNPEHNYICPVYKTSERRGVLSTTGHSTNFVMPCILPIDGVNHSAKFWKRRGVAMLTQLDQ
jgi:dynein heavy chain